MLRYAFLSGFVLEFITMLSIALVAVALGVRLLIGSISFETAFLVLLLAPEFYRPLRELGVSRHAGMEGKAAAEPIFEILNISAPAQRGSGTAEKPAGPLDIEFDGVSYGYPGSTHPALSGIGLTLPAGTCTAVVGRSGAGKSTLVNLLMRFADPESGRIFANGISISPSKPGGRTWLWCRSGPTFSTGACWRTYVWRVPPRKEKSRGGGPNGHAAEFVERLPRGYDTQTGERGVRLSAGETQRLAIARGFLKDAPVLILDEPTANLDPVTEHELLAAVYELMPGRTTLTITHRFVHMEQMDEILVLEEGRIVERGTHHQLLEKDGLYGRMFEIQNQMLTTL